MCMSQGEDVFPIPGTKRIKYLEENVAAYEISKTLTKEELADLEAAVPADQVRGCPYDFPFVSLSHEGEHPEPYFLMFDAEMDLTSLVSRSLAETSPTLYHAGVWTSQFDLLCLLSK